ncbi:MAG: hypothetical protein HOC41_04425 [Candidatus Marinimicrobia bacterium]|nr:hypothetical protein [Candidatus Neomarinimicrobiota bacterium]MBT5748572.1 hypothetical protein [Candidatus Neomarinimicrobiota bacterium]MBT6797606.1 hypothetical protein [Candidatus Neomarinimicrobiota bacterium]MDC0479866.1 hypothetical protein [Candidatus Neomarinimicrobiota bacterium]MDC1037544.1 hypothetical protein [Candidatus Neomarinimicrobiota bacterium]
MLFSDQFNTQGFALEKGEFLFVQISELVKEFNRIVYQLIESSEKINDRHTNVHLVLQRWIHHATSNRVIDLNS